VGSGLLSSGAGALSAPFKFAWAWARTPARAVAAAGRRGPGARNFSNCQQPEPVCVSFARLGPDSDAKAPGPPRPSTVARKQGLAPPGSTHGIRPGHLTSAVELNDEPACCQPEWPTRAARLFKKNLDAPG
jgi:hypothetical protein